MTVKVYVQISNITKVCVQNVLRVLECKLEDVDAKKMHDRFIDEHLVENVPTLSVKRDFQYRPLGEASKASALGLARAGPRADAGKNVKRPVQNINRI